MNPTELENTYDRLQLAACPEDVFGTFSDDQESQVRSAYRTLAKALHPDRYRGLPEESVATEAFKLLGVLWGVAQEKLALGKYGDRRPATPAFVPVTFRVRDREIVITGILATGALTTLYTAPDDFVVLKVARSGGYNDLLNNEAKVLRHLQQSEAGRRYQAFFPELVTTFRYRSASGEAPRQANLLRFAGGQLYSLEQVLQEHGPLDPKDMAWMFRRLLMALGAAHQAGVIHGAVTPDHVLIQPEQHGLVLVDWSYALILSGEGQHIPAINPEYEAWYPLEVLSKQAPSPGTDLYMAAECMAYVIGIPPGRVPALVNDQDFFAIWNFLRGCMFQRQSRRPDDAWKLLLEFDECIDRLWGPRKFRAFPRIDGRRT